MIGDDHRLALPSGHRLAEFRIARVLGQGGFGITYLAQDTLLNIDVAIKELLPRDFATRVQGVMVVPKRSSDAESFAWAKQRFINEARILASLRHENIVHVYRFLEAHGTAYMVMEFVQGRNLLEWIRAHRKPGEPALKSILLPLLDGLDVVHRKNVLHRDISPENIFVTADKRPMLLDFGSARATVDQNTTITGVVRPGYSPVEQYQSESTQGPYTDLYALAAVMIHAITGQVPPLSIDRCGSVDPHQPLAQRYHGKYGDHLLRALDAAFAVLPQDRPQNVTEFRKMLEGNFSRGKPQSHRPPKQPEKPPRRETTVPDPQSRSRKKEFPWLTIGAFLVVAAIGLGAYYLAFGNGEFTEASSDKSTPAPPLPATPAVASNEPGVWKESGYINSLGMKFVPVPGARVWFSVYQTRERDYEAYANAKPLLNIDWSAATGWYNHSVQLPQDHPVVMVSWSDANAFCHWLSETETKSGGRPIVYRLPTWEEWRAARGTDKYPWGNEPAPPAGAGNYADAAARRKFGKTFPVIPNYDDGFATTSPVGHFHPNKAGLFDFDSNVQEWSGEEDVKSGEMFIFGACWKDAALETMALREKPQYHDRADTRNPFLGFRCVIEYEKK